jgi:hypothetical protein
MRYYNNLRKFEEIKSFKRFKTDPIPGVDVVVEKIPPGNSAMVGINDTLPEDIEEALLGQTSDTVGIFVMQARYFPPSTDFEVHSAGNPLNGNGTATVYLHYIEVTI